jgi:hypothetical protein
LLFALFVVRCFGFNASSTNDIFGRSKVFYGS